MIERECAWSAAACVEAGQFAGGGAMDGEQVAAEAAHHGFDHAEHGVGDDGGVDGGSSARERLRAGLGCESLAGGDDSALCYDHGSGLRALHGGGIFNHYSGSGGGGVKGWPLIG